MPTRRNILLATIAQAVLKTVFAMYTQPDFLVQMANQLWSCF